MRRKRAWSGVGMVIKQAGFTIVELLIAVAIGALLIAIAAPVYTTYVERSTSAQAVSDLATLDMRIEQFVSNNFRPPAALADLPGDLPTDPWGRPYRYLRIVGAPPSIMGQVRKDRNLNPINSDYDLYSAGPDGESRGPLANRHSQDDVIRAGNGGFIGPAADF